MAVYSRCTRESPRGWDYGELPAWWLATGCSLRRTRVGTSDEKAVRIGIDGSAYLPSIWRSRLAFAVRPASARPAAIPKLAVRRGNETRLVRGGPTRALRPAGTLYPDPGATKVQLRGRQLAVQWSYYRRRQCKQQTGFDDANSLVTQVRLIDLGDGNRKVSQACLQSRRSLTLLGGFAGDSLISLAVSYTPGPRFVATAYQHCAGSGPRALGEIGTAKRQVESVAFSAGGLLSSQVDFESETRSIVEADLGPYSLSCVPSDRASRIDRIADD